MNWILSHIEWKRTISYQDVVDYLIQHNWEFYYYDTKIQKYIYWWIGEPLPHRKIHDNRMYYIDWEKIYETISELPSQDEITWEFVNNNFIANMLLSWAPDSHEDQELRKKYKNYIRILRKQSIQNEETQYTVKSKKRIIKNFQIPNSKMGPHLWSQWSQIGHRIADNMSHNTWQKKIISIPTTVTSPSIKIQNRLLSDNELEQWHNAISIFKKYEKVEIKSIENNLCVIHSIIKNYVDKNYIIQQDYEKFMQQVWSKNSIHQINPRKFKTLLQQSHTPQWEIRKKITNLLLWSSQ